MTDYCQRESSLRVEMITTPHGIMKVTAIVLQLIFHIPSTSAVIRIRPRDRLASVDSYIKEDGVDTNARRFSVCDGFDTDYCCERIRPLVVPLFLLLTFPPYKFISTKATSNGKSYDGSDLMRFHCYASVVASALKLAFQDPTITTELREEYDEAMVRNSEGHEILEYIFGPYEILCPRPIWQAKYYPQKMHKVPFGNTNQMVYDRKGSCDIVPGEFPALRHLYNENDPQIHRIVDRIKHQVSLENQDAIQWRERIQKYNHGDRASCSTLDLPPLMRLGGSGKLIIQAYLEDLLDETFGRSSGM